MSWAKLHPCNSPVKRRVRAAQAALHAEIIACRRCPRLVAWREEVAREKVRRFAAQDYWGKPLPGFGDLDAPLALVGLAPAAHGGNRTGRMFTGDESGNWLFRALHETGFASQPSSVHREDDLRLEGCYITAAVRCAPPANKPLPAEFASCRPFLVRELALLEQLRVVVGLGRIGFDAAFTALRELGRIPMGERRPAFGHGVRYDYPGLTLLGTYHPSQQNTFTGKLTREMLRDVFRTSRTLSIR